MEVGRPKSEELLSVEKTFLYAENHMVVSCQRNSFEKKCMSFKFENLLVWQKAIQLSDMVYDVTAKFPKEELYSLTSQMRRAGNSVSLNIAEGSTGQSDAEFKRFLSIALRSNVEVVGCLFIAKRRAYISQSDFDKIYQHCEEMLAMIKGLQKTLATAIVNYR
jgi:four helix bundle protein